MIVLQDVCKTYEVGEEIVRALDHASMHVRQGEFVGIIGPSGSGKSTLMNIVGCLDLATSGSYLLDGQPIEDYSETELARIRNKKIGFIFQNFNLITKLSAEENVELPLIYQHLPRRERQERVEMALNRVGLWNRRQHKPTELSGGQQQRVAIARALVTKPSLFLADEPTGNLDSRTSGEIMDIFHELHDQGNTIVLITHDNEVAAQAARRILIHDGHVTEVAE
ncbi:MAG: ABC transporter ATP-binding protein [Oscillospiraceae bacterium]|nr:ABC transporter ATP-binding protein [Oscillospiraceae bacterium]